MATKITLTNGETTIVDDADAPWLSQYRWSPMGWQGEYVGTRTSESGKSRTIYLHRLILSAPKGLEVDHINGDKRDNRRANLRLVTRAENEQNKPANYPHTERSRTGIRNVIFVPEKGVYRVRLKLHGKMLSFGSFRSLEEAKGVAIAARRKHMPFAMEHDELSEVSE